MGPSAAGKAKAQQPADELPERILRELYALYNDPSVLNAALGRKGLEELSRQLAAIEAGAPPSKPSSKAAKEVLLTPRRRVTVMLVGNHSSGKSSFINAYTGTKSLKSSVAVESTGCTLVRTGNKLANFTGDAALEDNAHLQAVVSRLGADRKVFLEQLTLLTVPSRARDFASVDLLDTPGLADGNLEYGYRVNDAILELSGKTLEGPPLSASVCAQTRVCCPPPHSHPPTDTPPPLPSDICDLVLVFMDPIGQALVSRTMACVEALNARCPEKVKYFLTKIDTVSSTQDRMKVMAQISSQLSGRLRITHGLEIPCIAVPVDGKEAPVDEANALPALYELISTTVAVRVQRNLDTTCKHCEALLSRIEDVLGEQEARGRVRNGLFWYRLALAPLYPLIAVASLLDLVLAGKAFLPRVVTEAPWLVAGEQVVGPAVDVLRAGLAGVGADGLLRRLAVLLGAFLLLSAVSSVLQCRVRGLGLVDGDTQRELRGHSGRVEAMLKRAGDLRQELVRAAEIPDYLPSRG